MAKLFQAQKIYEVSVTGTATLQQVITPIRHYKAIVKTGGEDVFIKWGKDNTLLASVAKTGNIYDEECMDVLSGGSVQTLQKPGDYDYFSVVCQAGETATVQIVVGADV